MILFDTNILIYIANGLINHAKFANVDIAHASITRIETLGYHRLVVKEELILRQIFQESFELALSEEVILGSIRLRQRYNLSLGDAIIAATALTYQLQLWTANIKDFQSVEGLNLYNPLEAAQ